MRFPYSPLPVRKPVYSLGGALLRYRPLVPIHIVGPQVLAPTDASIDSGSDDTVFPDHLAYRLGFDLSMAPQGEAQPAGSGRIQVRYGRVTLLLSDGIESCEWDAVVGFVSVALHWPLLGHAGFLEYFDVELRGAQRVAILNPNGSFSGRHILHRPSPT